MSHAYNKADDTFPHSKTGGVLGFPHSAKNKAIESKKGEKKEYDSLAHLKDSKTGYYNLKLHNKKKD